MLKIQKLILLLSLIIFQMPAVVALADGPATETGHIDADIFGKTPNWCHVSLSLYEAYDDNIFNTHKVRESDLITVVSPGIQVAMPATDQPAEDIATDTAVAGGRAFGHFSQRSFRRFKAYAGYAPGIRFYTRNQEENVVNHHAQAGMQLNLSGGLTLDAVERYTETYDQLQADISPQEDRYFSNLFTFTIGYPISEKFMLQADYTNFQVKYNNNAKNGFGNRADNSGTGYLYFKLMPKTALFLKYQHTDIDYENDISRNGAARNFLGGIKWDFGPKTRLNFQAGYGIRSYDAASFDDGNSLVYQLNVDYQVSSKTNFGLVAFQRNEESSESVYRYTRTTGLGLKLSQALTPKLMFAWDSSYNRYEYKGGGEEIIGNSKRIDDHFILTPSFNYAFRKWLALSLYYAYRQRDSDVDNDAYFGNIVALKITGAI